MSGLSKLYTLPESVRVDLHRRYLEQQHLTINDHLRWVVEQGYAVSRSSLQRYLAANKEEMVAAKVDQEMTKQCKEATRLRCLELAAQYYRGNDQAELLSLAERFLGWIQSAEPSRALVA
ncbi:phage protein Gp27 family protein [Pseudomonas fluorescens]|uniref:phage protein Gp27 family protein n=1 Tax=Pseudomonas fluorescens TaxID=294 RepID=UPI000762D243|nr:phage protein Gp27 family protein [Pseudomonas fluorescens]